MDARLLDRDLAKAGDNLPFWEVAVANDQASPLRVRHVLMFFDPHGDLGFDGLREQPLGAFAENLVQRLLGPWHADPRFNRRLLSPFLA